MKKTCFSHPPSLRSAFWLGVLILGLWASFPALTDAAKPGGGTTTTMVLTYTYGAPARWVARVDPLNTKGFQLSVSYDTTKLVFDGAIFKNPFTLSQNVVVDGALGVVTVSANNSDVGISSGDVDVFEILFKEIGSPRPSLATFTENFDGVPAPALPPGWTTSNAGTASALWVTSDSGSPMPPADSVPNAAYIEDSGFVESDARLDSPIIAIGTASAQLTFRHNFRIHPTRDAGVLEISINGGAFSDIIDAGGSFVTGGYNALVPAASGNPLAGRMAWTGLAFFPFRTTVVNLPASAAGQNIVLRWRMACGASGGFGPGWRLDNVSIADPPPPLPQPFMAFAAPSTGFIDALETGTNPPQTVHFDSTQIAPTTRTFTPGVFPHIWDQDGMYDNGHTGGPGTWQNQSPVAWDDLPTSIPFSPGFSDTPWNNDTNANDIAVFGGDPGTGAVKVCGPIFVGGFQFDISGYDIQGGLAGSGCTTNGALTLSAPPGLTSMVDTGANNAIISAPISGSSGLTKVGTGTLALTGANTYIGATSINAGTLLVGGGSGTGNTSVMVNNGGCVGGNGTISGSVNVSPGGAVLGGNGTLASSLTLANGLNLAPNSMIKLALGPGGGHSTLNRAAGPGIWLFDSNQGFTLVNLGAQPGFYGSVITGLADDPGSVGSWHINNPGFIGTFVYNSLNHAIDLNLNNVPPPLVVLTAVSRKNHGAAGMLTIPLSLISPFSVECRSSGGNHSFVFTFTNPVVSGSAIVATAGTGSISGSPIFNGNTMTVNLTGVSDVQLITMTLRGVTDSFAQVLADTAVSVYMLAGDTTGNRSVSSSDVSQTKFQSGTSVTNANCRQDVLPNGSINATDIGFVKSRVGSGVSKPAR